MEREEETAVALKDLVPYGCVSVRAGDLAEHSVDQSSREPVMPAAVVWPLETAHVSAVLRYANEHGVPVTAWGAGTSLEGNSIPLRGGIVLDMRRMDRILAVHAQDFQVTVQPGLHYKDMNRELAREGLFFAPDPGANASIGGMLANNAAGVRTVKYGATRDNVLALEVVLASGEVLRTGSRSVKQSAGYDLTHLFVGSEGTLGVITEATLKLAPLPEHFSAVVAGFSTVHDAAKTVFEVMAYGLEPAAMEIQDTTGVRLLNTEEGIHFQETPHLLMEFVGPTREALDRGLEIVESICRENRAVHYDAGAGREERERLWRARHKFFEILVRNHPGCRFLIADVAVPISKLPELIDRTTAILADARIEGQIMGHAGDGNLHVTVFYPKDDTKAGDHARATNARIVEEALALGGTCTGEHGVGIGKQAHMLKEHGAAAISVMRQLKQTLDPKGILNPGKVLPEGR
ncbi:MAG: FAD-linked oxidase C-terminal domain-containing protein [Candidatus Hydrogenedentota bacterium]